jgi:cytochrome c553
MPMAPNIAGNSELYLQKQLKAFRAGTRTDELMSVVAKGLSDADIGDLAAWYAAIEISVTPPDLP